ncbi:BN159_2729 family protein [Streptomyces sp. NPDC049097]|uniref:BN159_2729 family protein n=1 Tax=Streptomyces sp. NPDC049097 TaxID=3155497 RepID=UPI00341D967F
MTTTPDHRTDIEQDLTRRLAELARTFIADLTAQGHLTRTPHQHQPTPPATPRTPNHAEADLNTAEALTPLPAQAEPHRTSDDLIRPPRTLADLHALHPDPPQTLADLLAAHLTTNGTEQTPTDPPDRIPAPTAPPDNRQAFFAPHAPQPEPVGADHTPAGISAATPMLRGAITLPRTDHHTPRWASTTTPTEAHTPDESGSSDGTPSDTHTPDRSLTAHTTDPDPGRTHHTAATAIRLHAGHAHRLELAHITPHHDHITVHINAATLNDWEYWLTAINALDTATHRIGTTQTATGHINNTPIHLTAHHVPHLLDQATHNAKDPYYHHGRIYDLTHPHTDRHGQTWHYTGQRQSDNTPLLALPGTNHPPYPLTTITATNGPLTPTRTSPDNTDT